VPKFRTVFGDEFGQEASIRAGIKYDPPTSERLVCFGRTSIDKERASRLKDFRNRILICHPWSILAAAAAKLLAHSFFNTSLAGELLLSSLGKNASISPSVNVISSIF
jgi:hypothetical protein